MRFLQGVNTWIKSICKTVFFVIATIAIQCWQLAGVLIIAIYNGRPWECLFIFIGYEIGRLFFGKTYHAPSMFLCTTITWVIFYFLTSAVPSFHISITIPCMLGVLLAYVLAIINDVIEKVNKSE